ncbi:uncharacterized protein [Rutidosis leptorrhynchoides]|uniref:uncharacterized protein n=1 Tax=Rutidosis leptorrhynchoides TaxID=125765 RepID=UPI003A9A373D
MAKWAIELGEHDIEFRVRHAIKGQVLADFIAETDSVNEEDTKNSTQVITPKIENEEWKLYTDGASISDGSGAGLMLVNPKGKEFTYALRFEFDTTNNEAEYEALQNKKADALSKLASLTFEHLAKEVLVEVLEKKSILKEEVNDLIQEDEVTWMTSLQIYLETGNFPEDKNEARKIRIKAPSYKMMNGALYRRSFLTPWLRCVGPKQAIVIIQEMNEGICGLHAGPRSVVAKIMRLGYYWPTMHHDTTMVEVTNRDIVKGIEKRLGKCRKGWVDELPLVLWAHTTTPKRSNGETPYSLAYGTEAVLPVEIQVLTERTTNNENSEENLRVNLDLLEERREAAVIREASYKRMIEGYYNKRVKPSTFKVGEYVLRLNSASKVEYEGKLGPNWEGPYVITQVLGKGS